MKSISRRTLSLSFILALGILLAVTVVSYRNISGSAENAGHAQINFVRLAQLEAALTSVKQVRALAAAPAAKAADVATALKKTNSLIESINSAAPGAALEKLGCAQPYAKPRLKRAKPARREPRANNFAAVQQQLETLQQTEREAIDAGNASFLRAAKTAKLLIILGSVATTAILLWVFYLLNLEIVERNIMKRQLQLAMERLTRSNTELEQFAYIASHDLQEPLRMVTSYVQLLAQKYKNRLDDDANEFIGYAVDGATRMQNLINDLLDYSRINTRAKPLEPTDCNEIFKQAAADLQLKIKEQNAKVTNTFLPTINADSRQVLHLFENLIGNALKFHGPRPPEIHVSAEQKWREWVFAVSDNGIGIDPKYHKKIFVLFQRLHAKNEYPGTGMGLAICKKIVERHGGKIWVESEQGKGTTFYFTLQGKAA